MFITAGNVGMRINATQSVDATRKAQFRWDFAVNPKGKGQRVSTGGGTGWMLASAAKNQDEAWAVLQHLTSVESTKYTSTFWYPARKTAAEYFQTVDPQLPPKNRLVAAEGLTVFHVDPIFPLFPKVQPIIESELANVWANKETAQQAIAKIVPQVNTTLAAG